LGQEEDAAHAQFEEADTNKAEAWKLLNAERQKPQYSVDEILRLTKVHKEACAHAKDTKAAFK
jgi:hypothetical protein